jgi:hypothetical protein
MPCLCCTGFGGNHTGRNLSAEGRARIVAAQRARWAKVKRVASVGARKGCTMSPAARKRIAAAQKARWAKWRKAHQNA